MAPDVERAMRRPWRYWFEDGFAELALAAVFITIALAFYIETLLPPGPLPSLVGMLGPLVAVLGVGRLAGWAVQRVKARVTYPRTGYVAYRRERGAGRRLQKAALGAAVGALVGTVAALPALRAWVPAATGAIIGVAFLYGGYRLDLARFYLVAAFSMACGTLVSLARLNDSLSGAIYFAALSLALAISGACALAAYLRATEPLAEAEDHGP